MKYFRNTELTRLYNVSDKAVRNWIEAAQNNKIKLRLFEEKGKIFIADTLHNGFVLEELARQGRKYRNGRTHRKLKPSKEFYELFTYKQVIDIASNLDTFREFPHQYRYRGSGATYWDEYLHQHYNAGRDNTLVETIKLLRLNKAYLDNLGEAYQHVNVVDLGVGNGMAAKDLLGDLYEKGKLNRYMGIDCSQDLLDITERNIRKWFGDKISMEKYIRDITYERFGDIINTDSSRKGALETINIFLFLGGAITNFKAPAQALYTIQDSMDKESVLITSLKLDSASARRFFDYHIETDKTAVLPLHDTQALQLLNIDKPMYEEEEFFDEQRMSRFIQIRLKVSLSIHFEMENYQKTVEIPKGDRILLWRAHHYTGDSLTELYAKHNFDTLQTMKTKNQEYMLLVSKIKPKEHQPPPKERHL